MLQVARRGRIALGAALALAVAGCSREQKPLKLAVGKVTKTVGAQPIARTIEFGPGFEVAPKVESLTPNEGYTFVLFQLDVTNAGQTPVTFDGVDLVLEGSGLLEGKSGVYYLLKPDKGEATYMSIGKEAGLEPKNEIKPGESLSWQLMTTVKEGTKALQVSHPQASPVSMPL